MACTHCEGTNAQGVPKRLQLELFLWYCAMIELLSGSIVGLVPFTLETLFECESGVCGGPLELPVGESGSQNNS